jgi:hypothetical protein
VRNLHVLSRVCHSNFNKRHSIGCRYVDVCIIAVLDAFSHDTNVILVIPEQKRSIRDVTNAANIGVIVDGPV